MLRVAIVGCGKIADSHAELIQRIPGCEIVGVCDREELMARQLADRFPVRACYSDVSELLAKARPEVVHVTTPPQSHFELGRLCLEGGAHVYLEKPFTLDAREAVELLEIADKVGRKVTVGHDLQFNPVARRLRAAVAAGALGGAPVHMESYYCYELGGNYAKALLGDKEHWVRRLPGLLLHNIISHGVARISEYLPGDSPQVIAHGFVGPALRRLGEREIVDELRVIINDGNRTTAYFTFSSQMRPMLHQFRIFGPRHGFLLDDDEQTLVRLKGDRFKSYAEKFLPPMVYARQYLANLCRNLRLFLARDFHMKAGMKHLIESFYRSVQDNTAVPIPYREILLTARIMDEIFRQTAAQHAAAGGPADARGAGASSTSL